VTAARAWSGLLLLGLLGLWLAPAVAAHDIGVARASLEELPAGRYALEVDLSSGPAEAFAPPELPARCTLDPALPGGRSGTVSIRYTFGCAGEPLHAGDVLRLPWQREGVMLAVRWQDGSSAHQFFGRSGAAIEVPLQALRAGSGSPADAARRYLALGVGHILFGFDHLLFVLGLLLLVRGPWMLVKTVTAFTLAHSLTLALATLGVVEVPPRPVEAAIALSIVFLAAEILHGRQGRINLTHRLPWVIAFTFGLLHGLGFASALSQVGLPQAEIPEALLFFNLGVEIGQLIFVAVCLSFAWAFRRLEVVWPRRLEPLLAYAIGTLAAFWFMERAAAIALAS
jgi:hydrogenase/urease accessory protein HupE